jgi:hypothetical protein
MDGQDEQDEEQSERQFKISNLRFEILNSSYPVHPVHPCE